MHFAALIDHIPTESGWYHSLLTSASGAAALAKAWRVYPFSSISSGFGLIARFRSLAARFPA